MKDQEIQELWSRIVEEGRTLPPDGRERLCENNLPDILRTRYVMPDLHLTEASKGRIAARLAVVVRENQSGPDQADSRPIQETHKPHANGHETIWNLIVRLVSRGTRGHEDSASLQVIDAGAYRRNRRLVAVTATLALILIAAGLIYQRNQRQTMKQLYVNPTIHPAVPKDVPDKRIEPDVQSEAHGPNKPRTGEQHVPGTTVHPDETGSNDQSRNQKPHRPLPKTDKPGTRDMPYLAQRGAEHFKVGTFTTAMGKPQITALDESGSRIVRPGDGVYTHVRITTGDADKAEIRFDDGTTVQLDFNTKLELHNGHLAVTAGGSTRPSEVKLVIGRIWAKVQSVRSGSKFAVETPVATAAVRGTTFSLHVRKATTARSRSPVTDDRSPITDHPTALEAVLTVREGRVEFSNRFGTVEATAREETVATADSKPSEPKRIQSLGTFRLQGGRIYWVMTTSRLRFPEAGEKLVYPLGWGGLGVREHRAGSTKQVRINRVFPDSPAERAGLKVGDVIASINDRPVSQASDVNVALALARGAQIRLALRRGTETKRVALTTSMPMDAAPQPRLRSDEAKDLNDATRLMITGKTEESERALLALQNSTSRALLAAAHNNLGVLQETRDCMGAAVEHYQLAVRTDPRQASYRYNLGTALNVIGNRDRAIEELTTATRLAPSWATGELELVDMYSLQRRHDVALRLAEATLRRHPKSPEAWVGKFQVLMRARRTDAAREAVLKSIALEPGNAVATDYLGTTSYDRSAVDEGEKAIRTALELDPGSANAYNMLGIIHQNRGQLAEAERFYLKSIDLNPEYAAVPSGNLGGLYQRQGKMGKAREQYLNALKLDPNYISVQNQMGDLYFEQREFQEAEKWYRTAAESGDDDSAALAYLDLGRLYRAQDRWDEAERMYSRALEIDPTHAGIVGALLAFHRSRHQVDRAEKLFRTLIDQDPKNAAAVRMLADLHRIDLKQPQEAERLYLKAIELGDEFSAHMLLSNLYRQQGRHSLAEETLQKLLDGNKENPGIIHGLGSYYHNTLRLFDRAEALYRRSLAFDTKNSYLHSDLAQVLAEQGKLDEAESMYRKAMQLDPSDGRPVAGLIALLSRPPKYDELKAMEPEIEQAVAQLETDVMKARIYKELAVTYHYRLAECDKAAALFQRAMSLDPKNADYPCTLAHFYRERGYVDEAEKLYYASLQLNPQLAGNYHGLGLIYSFSGQFGKAEIYFRKSVELGTHDALLDLGHSMEMQGQLQEAESIYLKTIEVNASFAGIACTRLARLCRKQGKSTEAYTWTRKAVEAVPGDWGFYEALGALQLNRGEVAAAHANFSKAEEILRKKHAQTPNDFWGCLSLAGLLAEQEKDLDEALLNANRAIRILHKQWYAYYPLGLVHFKRKEYKEAEAALRKLLELSPGPDYLEAYSLEILGQVLEAGGRRDEAINAYRKALSIFPDLREAKEGLERLKGAKEDR